MSEIKLTQFSKGSGCGCKISPTDLKTILNEEIILPRNPLLIGGNENNEDAAIWKWDEENYLISTTDFFSPIVDDAFEFGKIAASNALSDVYAMGGKPFMALAILGWPVGQIPLEYAAKVMDGARLVCKIAGVEIAGGHSIDAPEPIFGLAVNGRVKSDGLKRNNGAQPGDILYLTKPLGNGIISAALKKGKIREQDLEEAIRFMTSLNDIGSALSVFSEVHAMTDVTGFGLLGHLSEMMHASNTSAEINFSSIPKYPFLKKYLDEFIYPDITTKNFSALSNEVSTLSAEQLFLLCDPQTSGGLLLSIDPTFQKEIVSIFKDFGVAETCLSAIGRVTSQGEKLILVN